MASPKKDLARKERIRALRRARQYVAEREGNLARVLHAYSAMVARDPEKAIWADK